MVDSSTRGTSPSPSLAKWGLSSSLSTDARGGSIKRDRLIEDGKRDTLTSLFWLAILPSWVPSTPKEFVIVVATKDLDIIKDLSATNRMVLFADASRTLFRIGSLISIIDVSQDDVLDSEQLSKERGELKERYEVVE